MKRMYGEQQPDSCDSCIFGYGAEWIVETGVNGVSVEKRESICKRSDAYRKKFWPVKTWLSSCPHGRRL